MVHWFIIVLSILPASVEVVGAGDFCESLSLLEFSMCFGCIIFPIPPVPFSERPYIRRHSGRFEYLVIDIIYYARLFKVFTRVLLSSFKLPVVFIKLSEKTVIGCCITQSTSVFDD